VFFLHSQCLAKVTAEQRDHMTPAPLQWRIGFTEQWRSSYHFYSKARLLPPHTTPPLKAGYGGIHL
jgi:hypothetical protein